MLLLSIMKEKYCYKKEEVSEIRYFSKDELLKRISNSYEGLTEKTGPWNFLEKILEHYVV